MSINFFELQTNRIDRREKQRHRIDFDWSLRVLARHHFVVCQDLRQARFGFHQREPLACSPHDHNIRN